MPIKNEDAIIISKEMIIRKYILAGAPFHSLRISPQTVAQTIVRAISIPHEVKVNFPILLFPIPNRMNWLNHKSPANIEKI